MTREQLVTIAAFVLGCIAGLSRAHAGPASPAHLILVVGAPGTAAYGQQFDEAAQQWLSLAKQHAWNTTAIGVDALATEEGDKTHRDRLQAAIAQALPDESVPLWIVMIGHGTSERGTHKFNLNGPDVSTKDLAEWLKPCQQQIVLIACASASAPFIPELSGPRRVIVTATKSGSENNYSRFGQLLAGSLLDPATDIDHDDEVSLLEAFIAASAKTEKIYRELSRLTTEHALLDDNGDKLGTTADFFKGVRLTKAAQGGKQPDGAIAARIVLSILPGGPQFTPEQLTARSAIEAKLDAVRAARPNPPTKEYWDQLEQLLIQLADLYAQAPQPQ